MIISLLNKEEVDLKSLQFSQDNFIKLKKLLDADDSYKKEYMFQEIYIFRSFLQLDI